LPKAFARKFDSWRILISFDKDKNGKIDWNEAGAYRQEARRKVMGSFDKNKDGELDEAEKAIEDGDSYKYQSAAHRALDKILDRRLDTVLFAKIGHQRVG